MAARGPACALSITGASVRGPRDLYLASPPSHRQMQESDAPPEARWNAFHFECLGLRFFISARLFVHRFLGSPKGSGQSFDD